MPPVDVSTPKASCTACLYFCFVALAVATFFAGAWTDGLVARAGASQEHVSETTAPQTQRADIGVQATATAPKLMDNFVAENVPPPPAYIPPPTQMQPIKKEAIQCTVTSICGGKDRNGDGTGDDVMVRDSSCKVTPAGTTCKYGCAAGTCHPQPGGTAQIFVSPTHVHSGETVTVSWSTKGVAPDSCSVKNLSPMIDDQWTGDQGTKTSSPIRERTPYLLSCTQPSGASFNTSATVELLQ